jgi:hypothetical protein
MAGFLLLGFFAFAQVRKQVNGYPDKHANADYVEDEVQDFKACHRGITSTELINLLTVNAD